MGGTLEEAFESWKEFTGEKAFKVINLANLKKLTNEKWLNLFEMTFNGGKKWIFASRHKEPFEQKIADAVMIVAKTTINGQSYLVVIKELRPAIWDGESCWEYSFPAGLIDGAPALGQTAEDAAIREFKEETGLKLNKILVVSPRVYSSAGMTNESMQFVFGEAEGIPTTKYQEEHENIEILLFDDKDIEKLLLNKTAKFGSKAWAILLGLSQLGIDEYFNSLKGKIKCNLIHV